MKGAKMYIILKDYSPVCWEKFPSEYEAKIWCIHNGLATYRTMNKQGDQKIVLNYGVIIEKIS